MLCIAFFVCLVAVWRRHAKGTTIVVPVSVTILSLGRLVLLAMTIASLISSFRAVKEVSPADKATVLAVSIGESMKYASFGLAYDLPIIAIAWLADLWLRKRQVHEASRAALADARCATHPSESATRICGRCGSFMCAECAVVDERRCSPCRDRVD
jgi:hypothetical protein